MFAEMLTFYDRVSGTLRSGTVDFLKKPLKSISTLSSDSIFYFPVIVSDQCSLEEIKMISRALEKQYAAFVAACISLMPFYKIPSEGDISINDYLRSFHQNIGINRADSGSAFVTDLLGNNESVQITEADVEKARIGFEKIWRESLAKNESVITRVLTDIKSMNENGTNKEYLNSVAKVLLNKTREKLNEDVEELTPDVEGLEVKTFDKEIFTNTDMKKANELLPTLMKADVTFIVGEEGRLVSRQIVIGVKTYIHKYSSKVLVEDIYQTIKSKRKFLQFVKFVTGEENSLADLILGINKIKYDVATAKKQGVSDRTIQMIKKRSRWAKLQVPYIMKTYLPNASIVITSNETSILKSHYGVDILHSDVVPTIMSENFLLGFVVLDQTNESAFISYEGHNYQFQEVPYTYLEREATESDRMIKQMYRDLAGRR